MNIFKMFIIICFLSWEVEMKAINTMISTEKLADNLNRSKRWGFEGDNLGGVPKPNLSREGSRITLKRSDAEKGKYCNFNRGTWSARSELSRYSRASLTHLHGLMYLLLAIVLSVA